jgi:zinc/manganese transport system substrate-binding protein
LIVRFDRGLVLVLLAALLAEACGSSDRSAPVAKAASTTRPSIVVTYAVLGALVRDVVGDQAIVTVLIPNGADPHDWEPSAKDIARLNHATLVVRNGLDLEGGLHDALDRAEENGVAMFVTSDHVTVRRVREGEGLPGGDADQMVGAQDPHLWMDPLTLKQAVEALGPVMSALGLDASKGIASVSAGLDRLNAEVAATLSAIPEADRKLVTGHESLGYFAARYGFTLVGAIVPSLTSQAGVSAAELAKLSLRIRAERVQTIFTEIGTPKQVAEAIGADTGASVVELATHTLPGDGTYASFLKADATKIVEALADSPTK